MDDAWSSLFEAAPHEFDEWRIRIVGRLGVELLEETGRWRAREVRYFEGDWRSLAHLIPHFTLEDFAVHPDEMPNPYMRTVVRQPSTLFDRPVPVGVVSNTYSLAQHAEVIEKCFEGLRAQSVNPHAMNCQVGLTRLGEWMNFRTYFPDRNGWSHTPAGENRPLSLRLECFNSVDGSSRLTILFGWFRYICSNGLVLGKTMASVRNIHDNRLDIDTIPDIIGRGMAQVKGEIARLQSWEQTEPNPSRLRDWVNDELASAWGKKAACRVYHIYQDGVDVELADPFAPDLPTEKPVRQLKPVPGAEVPGCTIYHVSQALSWVATQRSNTEERTQWQAQIPTLIDKLAAEK
jgi:hypothetical protein